MSTHFKGTVYADAFSPSATSTVAAPALSVGSGTVLNKILKGTITVDPASLALGAVADKSVTLTGAAVGDTLILNPPATALSAGFTISHAWVSATDTIKIRFFNAAGTDPLDVASGTWDYCLIRA